jgi:3-oxoacyl-[acyl-carrier protein] reductase
MTALVTGATQGIGAAIAERLSKAGYNIAINGSNPEKLKTLGAEVADKCRVNGVQAETFHADVSDYAQCETMVKAVKEKFGTIDLLVNNAGIAKDGLLARMPEETYDKVIAVNQKSVFNMCKLVSAIMIKQRSGRIINMTSVVGLYGNGGQFSYSASKAAIIGMTKSAAKELGGRGITVNAIAPGFIETPMTSVLTEEQHKGVIERTVLKRYGKPEEIAGAVAFLASEEASYITGQVIEISGGLAL